MTRAELITNLEHLAEYVKYSEDAPALREVIKMLKCSGNPNGSDTIYRQAAIDAIGKKSDEIYKTKQKGATYPHDDFFQGMAYAESVVKELPSAQPEPISEAYAKAVRTWLVQYQIKCAELQGRYTPYEVLGWIVSDWRKDNEIW